MSYFNTTNETGTLLQLYESKAKTQEEIILEMFKKHKKLSPTILEKLLQAEGIYWPITSIRRAISNLAFDRYWDSVFGWLPRIPDIAKSGRKTYGNYGRKEHIWKYIDK